jgi:hypothetical protein
MIDGADFRYLMIMRAYDKCRDSVRKADFSQAQK